MIPNGAELDRLINKGGRVHKDTVQLMDGRMLGKAELLMQTTPYVAANSIKPAEAVRREQLRIERHVVLQQVASGGFFSDKIFCSWDCCRGYIDELAPPQQREQLALLVGLVAANMAILPPNMVKT